MRLFGAVANDVECPVVVFDIRVTEPHVFFGVAVLECQVTVMVRPSVTQADANGDRQQCVVDESLDKSAHRPKSLVIKQNSGRVLGSANLLGNRIQRVQNLFRQFACCLIPKLGMRRDGVPDQFEALDVGRLERRR
jgi:hypothetical protein